MQPEMSWANFAAMAMPWFLDRFTLHDSGLLGVELDWEGRALIHIQFDLHWNPAVPAGHTELWIRFDRPYRVTHTSGGWKQTSLEGASSTLLSQDQRSELRDGGTFERSAYQHSGTEFWFTFPPDDDSLTRTVFELVNWGKVELLHAAPVRFAVADGNTSITDLASLSVEARKSQ
jgi:hypothetical protein